MRTALTVLLCPRRYKTPVRNLVLLYHRIGEHPLGPSVTEANFADHMEVLRERVDVVPLTELVRTQDPVRPRVAITFDDGYADNALSAAPILAGAGAVATFFIVSGSPDEELWGDRLGHLMLDAPGTPSVVVDVAGRDLRFVLGPEAGREEALLLLKRTLRTAPNEIERVLRDVARQTGSSAAPCPAHRRLDASELRELARNHEVGAHSRTHRMLTRLDDATLRDELEGSRDDLTAITGLETASIAYPYGGVKAFDDRVVEATRRAGFRLGCINIRGEVRPGHDLLRIPRHAVHDWPADEFRGHLSSWLDGDPQPSAVPALV